MELTESVYRLTANYPARRALRIDFANAASSCFDPVEYC